MREVGCEFFETLAGVDHFVAQGQCGECTVAGGGEFAVDHVAGLLAAERVIALEHFLKHVTIAHGGFHGLDAHIFQGELQTEVAHHGYHEGVVVEFARVFLGARENAHDLIAVDHGAVFIHSEATVGVTVESHAQIGTGGFDHGLQLFGMRGSGVLVDVVAVWRGVDHDHVGSCAAQRFRRDHGGGAVGAVSHDFQAFQRYRLGLVRPDGGDGGRGGHIILRGNRNYWTLLHLKYDRHAMAGHGESGSKGRSFGKDGADKIIEVPCGTVVYNAETGEYLCDVTEDGQEVILLKGGRGGQGNWHFKTATRQAPRFAQPGEPMQEMTVIMELKLLADVGLVGFPNAGKSTLLSSISAAKPKIADYPFTTLEPNLGIVSYHGGKSFVMADIPGIIEGASQGKGLGLRFLRHIERNSLLLFMVPADSDDIRKEYEVLLNELRTFNPEMLDKQRVLAVTKSDMLDQELMDEIEPTLPEGIPHVFISSVSGLGISVLKDILWEELNKESNKIEDIVHRPKDVTRLQQELKDMGEDEDIVYEYEEDVDDDDDIDYEYEEEDWEEK